jgi:hypothetical protein
VARDRIREAGANHYKLVLTLIFGSAGSAPDSTVEAPQLTLSAGIHVPHSAHHNVRLVIKIKAIANQLLDIDLGRTFTAAITGAAPTVAARAPALTSTVAATALASATLISAWATTTTAGPILSRWTVFTAATFFRLFFFGFCHFPYLPRGIFS